MRILPYKQGNLDAFCGIYSICNAAKLINRNIHGGEAIKLFGQCMRHLEKHKSLGKISTVGIDQNDLWYILNEKVLSNYSIKAERPFYRKRRISKNDYFTELRDYFEEGKKRSAIISLDCKYYDHWTVVKDITRKKMILYDSYSLRTVNIAKCVVHKPTKKKPYLISPKMTYFLYEK